MDKGPKKTPLWEFGLYGSLGLTLVILTVGGYFIGYWLDRKLGTSPYLSIVGLFLGIAAGFYQLYKTATREK